MITKTIGNFKIEVWEGGYPIWCELAYGDNIFKMHHKDLSDLKYAVESMIKLAKNALPNTDKNEV